MNIRKVAWNNIISSPLNTLLSLMLMTFGVGIISLLLLLNNHMQEQFQNNIRSIDMVVGAKGSPLQLILSSIYHVDNPTGNIPLEEVNKLTKNPLVDFKIPLSYGDSYNGFRIVGTTHQYPKLYEANLAEGQLWNSSMQVVLGDAVSKITNLKIGDEFFGTHGFDENGHVHDNHSYVVVGVFDKTNSVIDNLIITDLKSVWKVHDHAHGEECNHDHDHAHGEECDHDHNHEEKDAHDYESLSNDLMITSMLVKFKSPVGIIQMPRKVNETTNMQAALPIFEINRLTNLLGFGVKTINFIALIIMLVSGLSIFISLFNSLKKRKYELALMRVHGATKIQLIKLVLLEGLLLSIVGTFLGLIISRLSLFIISILVNHNQKISNIEFSLINNEIWLVLTAIFIGFLASLIPSFITYKINITKILSNA
ncbi:MAG: hypothetical protein CMD06_06505 [Flavobacteriales bacterium]|nr:hypothetical protein [Flavobacteriales bacterium]|tara:strand:- start:2261 stop:3532 length:1272 start_codon:yes stop_codon:yes gene_type:complete